MKKLLLISALTANCTMLFSGYQEAASARKMLPPKNLARANQVKINPSQSVESMARRLGLEQPQDIQVVKDVAKKFKTIIKNTFEKVIDELNTALDRISPEGIKTLNTMFNRDIAQNPFLPVPETARGELKTKEDLQKALQDIKKSLNDAMNKYT